jgi:hypothetical protein
MSTSRKQQNSRIVEIVFYLFFINLKIIPSFVAVEMIAIVTGALVVARK